jgi:hypothetical protein
MPGFQIGLDAMGAAHFSYLRSQRTLHGPSWRSVLARRQTALPRGKERDAWLARAAAYFALRDRGDEPAARRQFADISAAADLEAAPGQVRTAKLLVLADAPRKDIAERLALSMSVVEAWETLYFDVRDLRNATAWIAAQVIDPVCRLGDPELASLMKLAIEGGLPAICAWLDAVEGLPLDEADRLVHERLRLAIKADAALSIPLDSEDGRLKFLTLYVKLQTETKRLDLARERLAQRCSAKSDQRRIVERRLELQLRRADLDLEKLRQAKSDSESSQRTAERKSA